MFKKQKGYSAGKTCFLDVSAEEAQNLLMTQGKDGNFIIRPSESNAGSQSLTVRHNGTVLHIKIQNTGEVYDLYGGEQFSSLMDLVEYYKDGEKLRLQNGEYVRFSQPFFCSTTSSRCERWFHGKISKDEAIDKLKKQSGSSFLVRESESKEGTFVLSVKSVNDDIIHVIINKMNLKYDIGDGTKFNDLSNLIDNYRKRNIVAVCNNNQITFKLQKAVNLGSIIASNIPSRTGELLKRFPGQDKDRDGFWEEFEQIQHEENTSEIYEQPRNHGKKEENTKKNRFKNILPFDETRVILKDKDESDYINANYIDASHLGAAGLNRVYIATQGCLKHTVGDFWRMVWQEQSSVIVMTTSTVEMGKSKCFQYWPEEEGGDLKFDMNTGSIKVEFIAQENSQDFFTRILRITRETKKKGKTTTENLGSRVVYHYQFPEWPDKMAPRDTYTGRILNFIEAVNKRQNSDGQSKPLIVHCSAGIGRTGTFILIDLIINQIKSKGLDCSIDIPKTLVDIRRMRSGLVQTDAQYKFVYLALRLHIEMLTGFKSNATQSSQSVYANTDSASSTASSASAGTVRGGSKPLTSPKPPPITEKPTAVYANWKLAKENSPQEFDR